MEKEAKEKPLTHLVILISYSGSGGVEVITNHLVEGLVNAGINVELLLLKNRGPHFDKLLPHSRLKVTKLWASSAWLAVPQIMQYLKRHPDIIMLAIKDRAIQAAALANRLTGLKSRVVGQLHNNMLVGLANRSVWVKQVRFWQMRSLYHYVQHIVAVSADAAQALQSITQLPAKKVMVLANPVITPALLVKAAHPATHPWLTSKAGPVIVAAGRLSPQKNFPLLLRAFARVKQAVDAKLIIFGEGPQRAALVALCKSLDISADVSLPGFVTNPYAEMKQADLFVLSSDWEGSPTVLTECLALGVSCVSTDVGDVVETLQHGAIGPVTQPGDADALSRAILLTLNSDLTPAQLKDAVTRFRQDVAVNKYIDYLRSLS